DHDGIVFHAGGPDGSVNCAGAAGRCPANRTAASSRSTPLAKQSMKPGYDGGPGFASQRRYRSTPPPDGTRFRALLLTQAVPRAGVSPGASRSWGGKGWMETRPLRWAWRVAAWGARSPP